MSKFVAPLGLLIGACVWLLLFVILGTGLGTAFIAGGCVAAAGLAAAAMLAAGPKLDAPITASGLLLGIATFAIMEVVLSIPLWIDVISGLGVTALYAIAEALARPGQPAVGSAAGPAHRSAGPAMSHVGNGNGGSYREPVGAR
jgi:hypothetical protein